MGMGSGYLLKSSVMMETSRIEMAALSYARWRVDITVSTKKNKPLVVL